MNPLCEIIGANPSPYSLKLRAILRYRRIAHVWRLRRAEVNAEVAAVKPQLLPMLKLAGEAEFRVDSTPLAYELERRYPDARSIVPPDSADAFLCALIEDFADEWCTKLMFHYRWIEDETATWAARWIIQDGLPDATPATRKGAEQMFMARQRSRMALVGCDAANTGSIAASFEQVLAALAPLATTTRNLFGTRPSLADFALYGQLAQLNADPLPQRLIRAQAPAINGWLVVLDDASGLVGEWQPDAETQRAAQAALLRVIGTFYLPFLQANAEALASDAKQFEVTLAGHVHRQAPFAYQGKCLVELRRRWAALDDPARAQLRPQLAASGCLSPYFDSPEQA